MAKGSNGAGANAQQFPVIGLPKQGDFGSDPRYKTNVVRDTTDTVRSNDYEDNKTAANLGERVPWYGPSEADHSMDRAMNSSHWILHFLKQNWIYLVGGGVVLYFILGVGVDRRNLQIQGEVRNVVNKVPSRESGADAILRNLMRR
jgi:hypothetical protein